MTRGFVDDASFGVTGYALGEYRYPSLSAQCGYYTGTLSSLAIGCIYGSTELKVLNFGARRFGTFVNFSKKSLAAHRFSAGRKMFSVTKDITKTPNGGLKVSVTNLSNPFKLSVSKNVMVVDPKGNIIPVLRSQRLTGSPDGKWIQVRDLHGKPTGLRLDGAHSPFSHKDPRALQPHAHVPKITNLDGTPWLPVN